MKLDYQKKLDEMLVDIEKLEEKPKLLLHVCCGPCSSYVLEYLSKYFNITIYYYNPNIEPKEEYTKRVEEIDKLLKEMPLDGSVNVITEVYNNKEFKEAIRGYETLKEGSERCFKCYHLRMNQAAKYAKENNFDYFTTTLSISPYKNSDKLNEIGKNLEEQYNIKYLYADFKKKNGYKRSIELSKQYDLYRQDYCGCIYSKIEAEERKRNKEIKNSVEVIMRQQEKMEKQVKIRKNDYNKNFSFVKFFLSLLIVVLGIYIINDNPKLVKNILGYNKSVTDERKVNDANLTEKEESKIKSETPSTITDYYFYGNHFNIKGNIQIEDNFNITNVNLLLESDNYTYSYPMKFSIISEGITFYAGEYLNNGIILDNLNLGNYTFYIEVIVNNEKRYYEVENNTNILDTVYYTVSKDNKNNKIKIETDAQKMSLNVSENKDEVYDIVIDPGHGGKDEGACFNKVCETDYTLVLSNLLKEHLEKLGYKVALTRNSDTYLEKYGQDSRVELAYKSKAKLLISVHLNSSSTAYDGFEIYTSSNLDLSLARQMVNKLTEQNVLSASNNTSFRIEPGIYTRTFSSSDVKDINDDVLVPYTNISTKTNYYFMIRETGGYMTGAYVDGQENKGENIYRNSNVGIESYIYEVGYINNQDNVNSINKHKDKNMKAIAQAIDEYFKG